MSGHLHLKDTKISGNVMRWRKSYFPKPLSEKDLEVDERVASMSCLRTEGKGVLTHRRWGSGCLLRRDEKVEHRGFCALSGVCEFGIRTKLFWTTEQAQ